MEDEGDMCCRRAVILCGEWALNFNPPFLPAPQLRANTPFCVQSHALQSVLQLGAEPGPGSLAPIGGPWSLAPIGHWGRLTRSLTTLDAVTHHTPSHTFVAAPGMPQWWCHLLQSQSPACGCVIYLQLRFPSFLVCCPSFRGSLNLWAELCVCVS